ncbi:Prolyl 4-hydroxylase alpha subunit [Penicillium hetheringtonii]|uniref:Prolyl 4-hydroxylase alpha subunit n=1 Tax=Penicillium hetheringtonii TaxID=911720 RepID=A0AAD6DGZ1_9EURO|nr:Prolyl 4-hydroxylase alpha subunit [Penicillium hetheringtonii]
MASINIREGFLRGPPQDAIVHRIDFSKTSPPILKFKDNFAAVIDNFMTEAECKELLHLAEQSTTPQNSDTGPAWERAMINAGGGRQVMSIDSRKGGRIILDSDEIAERLRDRLLPFLREFGIDRVENQPLVTGLGPSRRGDVYLQPRLNERLRFLRYERGDYFRPHWDGCYVTPDQSEKSLFTVQLYLSGDGEQNMEELQPYLELAEKESQLMLGYNPDEEKLREIIAQKEQASRQAANGGPETLLGGATSFMDGYNAKHPVRVFPKTGSILIFQQRNLMHGGDDVFRGVKYTVRSDVMYSMLKK